MLKVTEVERIRRLKTNKFIQKIKKISKKSVKYIYENVFRDKIIANKYSLSLSCVL